MVDFIYTELVKASNQVIGSLQLSRCKRDLIDLVLQVEEVFLVVVLVCLSVFLNNYA